MARKSQPQPAVPEGPPLVDLAGEFGFTPKPAEASPEPVPEPEPSPKPPKPKKANPRAKQALDAAVKAQEPAKPTETFKGKSTKQLMQELSEKKKAQDPFERAIARLTEPDYTTDIAAWAWMRLGVELYSIQKTIHSSLQSHPRVYVRSCHDSGKSFFSAVLTCHHIDTNVQGEARVITTAPSSTQVRGVLWNEINQMHERAKDRGTPLPGRVNQTEWWLGSYMAAIGRKPNDYRPEQFAGFHARRPLVILDEADGLPVEMWDGVEALMTNRLARMLGIGNPLDPGSRFAALQTNPGAAAVIKIGYMDTPNFSGEEVSELMQDVLLSPEWVEQKRIEWGEDSPWWYGRVLGEYPPESITAIIRASHLQNCLNADDEPPSVGVSQLGIDVAGSDTGDYTVIRERRGQFALREWRIQTGDDDEIEEFIVDKIQIVQPQMVVMDATGLGFGFIGRIRRRTPGVGFFPVNFAAASQEKNDDGSRKFANLRAEIWWRGRELARAQQWNLGWMENAEMILPELTAPRYREDVLAQRKIIQVEEKYEVRKRLGRSPDGADALLLAFHPPRGGGPARLFSARGNVLPTGAAIATH